ncbi:hypothetical protein [Flavobacterium ginsenosidimutans]|uniref:hypothetical protein n=1 Tax=Flavobacterium ginsenosidimutans TaxID=687844 RepID=UPI003D9662EF
MPRDEFLASTKRELAQRAGYLCSICSAITVGPSHENETSVSLTGQAAHISAASGGAGSRRYDLTLTTEQRKSMDNGIWLCNNHATLIDRDEETYTVQYLKNIKHDHEEKIRLKQLGVNVEKGLVSKIELSNFGQISSTVTLNFTDRNIIYGDNGVGKTLILELIGSLSDKSYLDRWTNERRTKVNSFCNIHYIKKQTDKFSISIDRQNRLSYSFNNAVMPFLLPTMSILYISESYWDFLSAIRREEREKKSTISLISSYFKLTENELINIIGSISRDKKLFFNDIDYDKEDHEILIRFNGPRNEFYRSFRSLSNGEQLRVLLEITIKIAHYYSKFNSTILLIEKTSFSSIDYGGINKLFRAIHEEKPDFQFFFTAINIDDYDTEGFKVYELATTVSGHVTAFEK